MFDSVCFETLQRTRSRFSAKKTAQLSKSSNESIANLENETTTAKTGEDGIANYGSFLRPPIAIEDEVLFISIVSIF